MSEWFKGKGRKQVYVKYMLVFRGNKLFEQNGYRYINIKYIVCYTVTYTYSNKVFLPNGYIISNILYAILYYGMYSSTRLSSTLRT